MLKRVVLLAVGLSAAMGSQAQALIADQFQVSPTGAATYQVPLQIPPGVVGVEPKLAIVYNSQQANGTSILAAGWGVAGLSAITRCPQTMAQDPAANVNGAVTFTTADRYCLDGKRLIAISGVDGADGTEYRTEIDTYSKVISHTAAGVTNGPASFTVTTRAGLTMEYGVTTNSRVMGTLASGAADTAVATWAVDRLTDRSGNYVTFTYTLDTANGQYYPLQINYTGNLTSSPVLAPAASVNFVYEARPDVIGRYSGGRVSRTAQRLTKIYTALNGTEINEYRIAYNTNSGTNPSQITTISLCDTTNACLPPKTYGMAPTTWPLASATWTDTSNWNGQTNSLVGDFDGDGRADVLVISSATSLKLKTSTGSGFTESVPTIPSPGIGAARWIVSLDGDTRAEVLTLVNNLFYAYKLSNGAFTVMPGWNGVANPASGCCSTTSTFLGDFNGDGLTDLAWVSGTTINQLVPDIRGGFTWISQNVSVSMPAGHTWTGDFNGDGMTDIATASGGTITVLTAAGLSKFIVNTYTVPNNWGDSAHTWVGDFNGDGRADIATANGGNVWVNLSTGSGFVQQVWTTTSDWDSTNVWARDMNGDGKTDLITATGGTLHIKYSTGSGFNEVNQTIPNKWGGWTYVADFNGDGFPDIASVDGANVYMNTSGLATVLPGPNLLQAYSSSSLQQNLITYATLMPSGPYPVYTVDYQPAYPQVAVMSNMRVVSSATNATALPLVPYSDSFHYHTAIAEAGTGRGFLGFAKTDATNGVSMLTTTTEYQLSFPFTGMPFESHTNRMGSNVVGPITNPYLMWKDIGYSCTAVRAGASVACDWSYPHRPAAGAVAQLYVRYLGTSLWDLDGTPMPGTTINYSNFDAYGNVGSEVTTVTQNGTMTATPYTKTVTNTFYNDPSTWKLGLLTKSVTTTTAPDLPAIVAQGSGNLPPAPGPSISPSVLNVIISMLLSD